MLNLYTSDSIDEKEFKEANDNYNIEINNLENEIETYKKQKSDDDIGLYRFRTDIATRPPNAQFVVALNC